MSEKQSKQPRPAPVLAGRPLSLPEVWGGGWAVSYDLDAVLELPFVVESLTARITLEQEALSAERENAPAADIPALNLRQRELNRALYLKIDRYAVARVYGPGDASWSGEELAELSPLILQWLAQEGVKLAREQAGSPFLPSA